LDIKSNRIKYGKNNLAGAGTQTAALAFGGDSTNYSSNRRMDRSRSSGYKNNYNKLIGGKNGT
jgi:hypothetical protein